MASANTKRVNVNLPVGTVEFLDKKASEFGMTRTHYMMMLIENDRKSDGVLRMVELYEQQLKAADTTE